MAQITWQNVNAPDFQGTADSYKTFADLFSSSMGDLSRGVTAFQEDRMQASDNALLQDAMRYQDPAKLREALNNGTLLGGPGNQRPVSAAALNKLGGMAGTLANQDAEQFKNTKEAYTFGNTVRDNNANQAARPVMAALLDAATRQDPAKMREITAANRDVIGQLPLDQQRTLYRNGQEQDQLVSNVGDARNTFQQQEQEIVDKKYVDPFLAKWYGSDAAANPDTALRIFAEAKATGMPQTAYNKILSLSPDAAQNATGYGAGAPDQASAAIAGAVNPSATGSFSIPSGSTGYGTTKGSAYDVTVGGIPTPAPITQMTMGQLNDFGAKVLIPGNRGKYGNKPDEGSSAAGAWQITNQTREDFGKRVFGDGWRDVVYSPENQDKLGKAIFEDSKNKDLSARWMALKKVPGGTVPGAFKDMSWDQFKRIIGPGESGGDPGGPAQALATSARPGAATSQQTMVNETEAESAIRQQTMVNAIKAESAISRLTASKSNQNLDGLAFDIAAAQESEKDLGTVVSDLRKTPAFAKDSERDITKRLETVKNRAAELGQNISDAVAAAILNRTMESGRSAFNPARWGAAIRGSSDQNTETGYKLDSSKLDEHIRIAASDVVLNKSVQNKQSKAIAADIAASRKSLEEAQAALSLRQRQAGLNPEMARSLPSFKGKLEAAQAKFDSLIRLQRQSEALNPPNGIAAKAK